MSPTVQLILLVITAVFGVAYVMRRRARLRKED